MEKYDSKSRIIYKKNNSVLPFEPVENLSKKRPSSTKLDLVFFPSFSKNYIKNLSN